MNLNTKSMENLTPSGNYIFNKYLIQIVFGTLLVVFGFISEPHDKEIIIGRIAIILSGFLLIMSSTRYVLIEYNDKNIKINKNIFNYNEVNKYSLVGWFLFIKLKNKWYYTSLKWKLFGKSKETKIFIKYINENKTAI